MKNEIISQTEKNETKRRKKTLLFGIIIGLIVGILIMFLENNSVISTLRARQYSHKIFAMVGRKDVWIQSAKSAVGKYHFSRNFSEVP
ncbi:hypothetical protein HYV57_03075 [Candidatus Peregrinibacteria bacterium]|nr:hypothetical protein [Candidatus Peregrinibacteria bacterium]